MNWNALGLIAIIVWTTVSATAPAAEAGGQHRNSGSSGNSGMRVELGPRPFFIVEDMDDDTVRARRLKTRLQDCSDGPFNRNDFSIGHRGACMQFPEHTRESYEAAARMGAGIIECDVTFTKDRELVCRHSQCDLHLTTNILAIPELAAKCSQPFKPATFKRDGTLDKPASARCCTSDITLDEYRMLCGKMDGSDPAARTVEQYLDGTPGWRTDLYSTCGTLMTHAESIELFKDLGVKMIPELKAPAVDMPYEGVYTRKDYARQMIDEYKAAGVPPSNVYAQSFNLDDVLYWIESTPLFGRQAVLLDGRYRVGGFNPDDPSTWNPGMEALKGMGVNIIAPPMYFLLKLDSNNKIKPSAYGRRARRAGLDIVAWTLERSGTLEDGGGWYYQSVSRVIDNSGDTYTVLDVLARDVGVKGVFTDWPATVSYYANCLGLGTRHDAGK